MKRVSVIIPNFNGRHLLKENLPALLASLGRETPDAGSEVIVVDDGSTDGSAELVAGEFPSVKLIRLDENHGFAYACNAGAKAAAGEIIYLLNSDIKVTGDFLGPIIQRFDDESVFAVSSAEEPDPLPEGRTGEEIGIALLKFKYGIFWYWYEDISKRDYVSAGCRTIEVFCVSGGHSAYDKKKYLELGGFDTLFSPFYAEDGDICWRAWKRGWKSLLEPRSVVKHNCRGTIGKLYSRSQIQAIHWKNRLLMMWKNFTSARLWLRHMLFIKPEVLICPLIGRGELTRGFFLALKQIPEMLRSRKRDRIEKEVYTDDQLFTMFSDTSRFLPCNILYLHETGRLSGAENSLLNLVMNLDKAEFKPVFACPGEGLFADSLRSLGVKLYPLEFPRVRNMLGVRRTLRKIRGIVKEEKISLIHSNSIRTHIYAALAGKPAKIPVVWHERNLIEREIVDPDRALAFIPDAIVCNSGAIAERFAKGGRIPEKVHIIYNGVDTSIFSPAVKGDDMRSKFNIAADEIVIGIASRFSANKAHETFLSAAAELLKRPVPGQRRVRFIIAGGAVFAEDIAREKDLRGMVKSLGIGEDVIFTGFIKDMPAVYAMMDIFVLASDAEPCGRVILEAMAMGKPVIGTRSGGTPEIIIDGTTGLLTAPRDALSMSAAMVRLVDDERMRNSMGSEGRRRCEERFSIQKNTRKTEGLYLELLRRPR